MVTFLGQVCVICFLQPSRGVNGDFVLPGFEVVFDEKRMGSFSESVELEISKAKRICFWQMLKECISDISLSVKDPHGLTLMALFMYTSKVKQ